MEPLLTSPLIKVEGGMHLRGRRFGVVSGSVPPERFGLKYQTLRASSSESVGGLYYEKTEKKNAPNALVPGSWSYCHLHQKW